MTDIANWIESLFGPAVASRDQANLPVPQNSKPQQLGFGEGSGDPILKAISGYKSQSDKNDKANQIPGESGAEGVGNKGPNSEPTPGTADVVTGAADAVGGAAKAVMGGLGDFAKIISGLLI